MRGRSTGIASIVVLIVATVAGAVGGGLVALAGSRRLPTHGPDPVISAAGLIFIGTAFAAIVLVAWFMAFVALSWTPGRFRCPRCGTANARSDGSCAACLLPFA